ncbi:MAG: DNA-directed RNA polymerase [Pseudomonas sp.]
MKHFTGLEYLYIDIANAYGLDKEIWEHRINWATHRMDTLETHTKEAEEPAQYLAAVKALRDTQAGLPTGYMCGLDATASGLQLLAVLSGCVSSAQHCNLVDTGKREDAYTTHYEAVNDRLGTIGRIPRNDVKKALMTHLYSSKAVPQRVFGEGTPELAMFYEVVDDLIPGANTLNKDMQKLWNPEALAHEWVLPDGFDVVVKVMVPVDQEFVFLNEVHVITSYVNQAQETGRSLSANITHSVDGMVVREMGRRCNYDPALVDMATALVFNGAAYAESPSTVRDKDLALLRILELHASTGFLSAVVLEYLDPHNFAHLSEAARQAVFVLIDGLPAQPFPLLAVHDQFKFHANHGNDVRQQYIDILTELADSEIMSDIASQLAGKPITVNKLSDNLGDLIRSSEYAIC